MTTTAQSIIKDAQIKLHDLAGIRWPASELVAYLNSAQRDLVVVRPDANPVRVVFSLVAGESQTLPDAAASLIDIPRNSAGNKRAIFKADIKGIDAVNPNWRGMTAASEVVHFCYDLKKPLTFDVYPPAIPGSQIDLVYSAFPTSVATPSGDGRAFSTVSGNIGLDDTWATALFNYVLWRAYDKDVEFGGNAAAAASHLQTFQLLIGAQLQGAQAVAPTK